jgi:SAM-dependent methyltransferase
MTEAARRQEAQIAYWNSIGGDRWTAAADHTDQMLAPIEDALLARANPRPGMAVLEIGCGCGGSAVEIARRVGGSGRVLGVDVSQQMIAVAKSRLADFPQAEAVEADAAAHAFEPFADLVLSRFGVMFFGDPAAAFANIRKAMKPGARLLFAAWCAALENEWVRVPLEALLSADVPPAPPPAPEEPGPFSFADPERIKRILAAAGFTGITVERATFKLDLAAGLGLEAAVQQAMTIGAAAALLRKQPEELIRAGRDAIAKALPAYERDGTVMLAGETWMVEAR